VTIDHDATRTHNPDPPTQAGETALDAGLAAAFGPDLTPGGWSHPPLLRDDPSDHSPLVQTSSPEIPADTGSPYQLLGEIARGGMGVILKGRDPDLGRDLAIKVLRADLAHRPAAEQRFVEEAQVGGQLQHPGIVPIYDLGRFADGRPYFAMKLVKGGTLTEQLSARQNPSTDRGRFLRHFLQVCQTMAYAHSKSVIHRDLKPSNIMVGAFDEVLVMDWGLAKVLPRGGLADEERVTRERAHPEDGPTEIRTVRAGSGSDTTTGSVLGTPAFMSPEQAAGEIDKLDERVDVFGLGAILSVILTGQPPYVADTFEEVRLMAVRGQLGACFTRLDDCGADAELVELCKRCLSADRDARPRYAGVVANAVAAYLTGVEERAKKAELDRAAAEARAAEESNTRRVAEEKALEERKRRKVQLALAAAVGLLLLGGGAFGWYTDRQAEQRKRELAEIAAEQERADGVQRAIQARLEGERDAEVRNKREQAQRGVTGGLQLAADLRKQYKFRAAETALNQALALARDGAPDVLPVVEQARKDLAFVIELDDIRYRKWVGEESRAFSLDPRVALPAYRRAFAARGLDPVALEVGEVVRQVTASEIRAELVSALDDWAVHETDRNLSDRLLAVTRRADPGPWTDRLRNPGLWHDPAELARLVADLDPATTTPEAVCVLARLLQRAKQDPAPLLKAARVRHPTDFELAFTLGLWYNSQPALRDPEQIGPYEAARAIRPENFAVWTNLGNVLGQKGDTHSAVACYEVACRINPNAAAAHVNLGNALNRKGEVEAAIACFKEAIRIDPLYASAHFRLGVVLHKKGDEDRAITCYKVALRIDPNYAAPHTNLGNVLNKKGDVDSAIASFKEAIRLNPNSAGGHTNLGNALNKKGDAEGAIASYKEAIRLDPLYADAHFNLGLALQNKGALDGAITCYKVALRIDPIHAGAYTNLGNVLGQKGNTDVAIACFKEAIRLDPNSASAHNNLGLALNKKGDAEGAIACFKEAVRVDPLYASAHFHLGNALQKKGDVEGAIASFEEAIRINPRHANAHFNLGVALDKKGDADGTIACFKEAVRIDPNSAGAHNGLGMALQKKGDVNGALAQFKEAVRLDPNYADAHTNLGNALSQKGDANGAIACYREAIRSDPNFARAHFNLGNALNKKGDEDGAIACYKEAIRSDSNFARAHFNLGNALNKKGDGDGAITCLKEAIRLDPKAPEAHCSLGLLLSTKKRFAEALPLLKRGHELGSKQPGWRYPSAKWVADCERALAEQEGRIAPPPHEVKR
jgi:tetratricopeptide (TPR) repeat protein